MTSAVSVTRLVEARTSVPEAVVQVLAEAGVDVVFGISGGYTGRLFAALAHHTDTIRTVLVRHESVGIAAAEAYGRLTGRPGVMIGQGAWLLSNAGPGLLEALLGGSPVVLLGDLTDGSPVSHHGPYQAGTGEWGNWDAVMAFRGVCASVVAPHEPVQAVQSVQLALKHALTGQRGPAAVLFHSAAIHGQVEPGSHPALFGTGHYLQPSEPVVPDLSDIARRVRASRRPVLIVGGGAQRPTTEPELRALAVAEQIPIVTTAAGKGAVAESDPLCCGVFGNFGWPLANAVVSGADLVLAIGTKLGPSDTAGENPDLLDPHRQDLIQIDIEPRNAAWTYPAVATVIADAGAALAQLRDELARTPTSAVVLAGRRAAHADAVDRQPRLLPERDSQATPIHPQRAISELRRALPDDAVVCVDAGENRLLMLRYFETRPGGRYLQPSAAGGMGYAIPAALAAKLALPGRVVVAVCGDGGFGMSLPAILTAIEERVPVVVVVLNNRALGWVRHGQLERDEAAFKSELHDFDLAAIARAMGCHATRVEDPDLLSAALRDAISAGSPAVVEVVVSTAETYIDLRSPLVSAPRRVS